MSERIGLGFSRPDWQVVLPMGISFYTFQSMSYTIDVYRGQLRALPSFRDFILFIAFFPQLVAGPIVRASEFLPQMPRVRRIHWPVVATGLALIVEGYFLKMVCADNLATYVDKYWEQGYRADGNSVVVLWLALLFSGQIFCDFAGYSQIARGCAYLLGYQLPINFRSPYIAGSFKNFWERWHITLSRWLRDYLYVPLGGNRVSPRAHLRQPAAGDAARRPVARRGLDVRRLGRAARRRPGRGADARPASWPRAASLVAALGWGVVVQVRRARRVGLLPQRLVRGRRAVPAQHRAARRAPR